MKENRLTAGRMAGRTKSFTGVALQTKHYDGTRYQHVAMLRAFLRIFPRMSARVCRPTEAEVMLKDTWVTAAPMLCPVCACVVRLLAASRRANRMTDVGPIDCSQSSGLPAEIGPVAKSRPGSANLSPGQAGAAFISSIDPAEPARRVAQACPASARRPLVLAL